jgi:hypothetical protein
MIQLDPTLVVPALLLEAAPPATRAPAEATTHPYAHAPAHALLAALALHQGRLHEPAMS